MLLYICISFAIASLGILFARLFWPCLYVWPLWPFLLVFISMLMICIGVHMSQWRCWTYLFCARKRLYSTSTIVRHKIPYLHILSGVLCIWSIFWGCIAHVLDDCHIVWWPSLIVPCLYTVVICSLSTSCSSKSSPSDSGSSIENELGSGSFPCSLSNECVVNGMSSSSSLDIPDVNSISSS